MRALRREAGGTTSNLHDWPEDFVSALAANHPVCLYSLAGGYGSDPVSGLLTRRLVVHDAFTVLERVRADHGISGPYLLVGWSFGGSVILAEALERPSDILGLVVLDTDFPADFIRNCLGAGRSQKRCAAEYAGDEEAKSIEVEIVRRLHDLGRQPIRIVSAVVNPDCSAPAGTDHVSADIAGDVLTAPTCEALARAIADKQAAQWSALTSDFDQARVQASHNSLPGEAGPQIIAIIESLLGDSQ